MFLSPVFPVEHDTKTETPMKEPLIAAHKKGVIDKKVMALGGVTMENLRKIKDMGFGGAVILRDLWSRFDIHSAIDFKELSNYFKQLKKVAD